MARKMVYRPLHELAGRTGYLSRARAVLWDKIGQGTHPCHWCQTPVTWMKGRRGDVKGALIADHLDGDVLNDTPENLVPACHACNSTRQRTDLIPEGAKTLPNGKWRVRAEERTCKTCGKQFTFAPAKQTKPGSGRYCSRTCMYRRNK